MFKSEKVYFVLFLFIINSDNINGSESENILSMMTRNNMQNETTKDHDEKIEPIIHDLFIIKSNDTTEDKIFDQTFLLSKLNVNERMNDETGLHVGDDLKFKVTEIIGIDKLGSETTKKSTLDMYTLSQNLKNNLAQRISLDKLRSILIRRRKIDVKNKLSETQINITNNNGTQDYEELIRMKKQVDNLDLVPFTAEDAIDIPDKILKDRTVTENLYSHNSKPENHAEIYTPIKEPAPYQHQNTEKPNSWYLSQNSPEFIPEFGTIYKGIQKDDKLSSVGFLTDLYRPRRQDESFDDKINFSSSSSENIMIVGTIPKPLPSEYVYEPYKNQFVLPDL